MFSALCWFEPLVSVQYRDRTRHLLFSGRRNSFRVNLQDEADRRVCWNKKVAPLLPCWPSGAPTASRISCQIPTQGQAPHLPLSALIFKRSPARALRWARLTFLRPARLPASAPSSHADPPVECPPPSMPPLSSCPSWASLFVKSFISSPEAKRARPLAPLLP